MRRFALVLLGLLVACGNPENQVFGGITGNPDVPNAFLNEVRSAVAGVAKLADEQGNEKQVDVFILSDRNDVCGSLGRRPDYFKNPQEAFVALIMITEFDKLGVFDVSAKEKNRARLLVTAGPGFNVISYPASLGSINVREFNASPGGDGAGTFDIFFADQGNFLHELFGKFKTTTCAALANVTF